MSTRVACSVAKQYLAQISKGQHPKDAGARRSGTRKSTCAGKRIWSGRDAAKRRLRATDIMLNGSLRIGSTPRSASSQRIHPAPRGEKARRDHQGERSLVSPSVTSSAEPSTVRTTFFFQRQRPNGEDRRRSPHRRGSRDMGNSKLSILSKGIEGSSF